MAAASRPTPGAPVESTWGGQVHDAAVLARGVIVSGAAVTSTGVKLPLDTVVYGAAALVDLAANDFVAPMDGVYELAGCVEGGGAAVGSSYFVNVYLGTGPAFAAWSASWPTGGGSVRRGIVHAVLQLAAGARIYIEASGNGGSGGSLLLQRGSFRLIAQAYG